MKIRELATEETQAIMNLRKEGKINHRHCTASGITNTTMWNVLKKKEKNWCPVEQNLNWLSKEINNS